MPLKPTLRPSRYRSSLPTNMSPSVGGPPVGATSTKWDSTVRPVKCSTVTLSVLAEANEAKLSVVASRAVRKMSVFQRRGMAISPWWWGSIVPVAGREGGSTRGVRHERPQLLE
jgi:hypothetical protein